MKKLTAMCLCAALLLGASACGSAPAPQESESPALQTMNTAYNEAAQSALTYVGDYATLLSAISSISVAAEGKVTAMGTEPDSSGVQLSGEEYDGASSVTADNGYIYMLSSGKLLIYTAAGPDTKKVTELTLGYDRSDDKDTSWNYEGKLPSSLYVFGDRLVAVSEYYAYRDFADTKGEWVYDGSERTYVDIYDISDPSVPKLVQSLGQDGILTGSRLSNGTLYVVSRWMPSTQDESRPDTFVPSVYAGDSSSVMAAERVAIMPSPDSSVYSVACAYDIAAGKVSAAETVLGADGETYFDDGGICFSSEINEELRSQEREESVYSVVDCSMRVSTFLCRLDTADGGLAVSGVVKLSGAVADGAVSVSDGDLMAVTAAEGYDYSIYTDSEKGFVNETDRTEAESTAAVTVVDTSGMKVLTVAELIDGEVPENVWFSGTWAYYSTADGGAMSAVDMSDPASPHTVSELKMTSFADYLRLWSENRVLGLGESDGTSDASGGTGMQLVMYDTTDPSAVSELNRLSVDDDMTEALANTDAILIDSANFTIAFPAGTCYDVYGWTETQGFFLRSRIETGEDWSAGVRGVNADGYEYLIGASGITVIDVTRAIVAARVAF